MAAPEREHPEAREQIEVALPFVIEQVRPGRAREAPVEADGLEHLDHLRVQVALVQGERVVRALAEFLENVERHIKSPETTTRPLRWSASRPPPSRSTASGS